MGSLRVGGNIFGAHQGGDGGDRHLRPLPRCPVHSRNTYLAQRDLPWFRAGWNAIVGVPLLIPSFLYENVHTEHRERTYTTDADPEYIPLGRRSPLLIATSVLAALLPSRTASLGMRRIARRSRRACSRFSKI